MFISSKISILLLSIILVILESYHFYTHEQTNSNLKVKKRSSKKFGFETLLKNENLFSIGNIEMVCKNYFDENSNQFLNKKELKSLQTEFFTGKKAINILRTVNNRTLMMNAHDIHNEPRPENFWLNSDFFQYVLIENWTDRNFKQNLFTENLIKELLKEQKLFFDDDILKASYLNIEQNNVAFREYMKKNNYNEEKYLNPRNLNSKDICFDEPAMDIYNRMTIKLNSNLNNCLKQVDPLFILPGKKPKCLICKKGYREKNGKCEKAECQEGCMFCNIWPYINREDCLVCDEGYTKVEEYTKPSASLDDIQDKPLDCYKINTRSNGLSEIPNCKQHSYIDDSIGCFECKEGYILVDSATSVICKSFQELEKENLKCKSVGCNLARRWKQCRKVNEEGTGCQDCYYSLLNTI